MEKEVKYCLPCDTTNTPKKQRKRELCIYEGCKIRPSFNFEGNKKGLYCFQHKLENMTDVIHPTCIYLNCKVRPMYNIEGNTNALYCASHKQNGMIDVKNKRCIYEGCKTNPSFNFEKNTKRLYCSKHKIEGMIDISKRNCVYEGCKTTATYCIESDTKPLFCSKHSKKHYVIVSSKRCSYEGCIIQPSYNFKGKKKSLYCFTHKLDGMIDVKNKTCIYEGCNVNPIYNFKGKTKRLYCAKHKLEGMINIKHKPCIYEGCEIRPIYNVKTEKKALYCSIHKIDGMVNVMDNTCKNNWCHTIVKTQKYDGYCQFCYVNMFPDNPLSRNYKTKEYSVVNFVKTTFPHYDWIADKKIEGGCSKRRPDLLLDLGYQIIVIEIDENQHIDYDCSCENKRIMELSLDVGHRPIVFIRFNPDDYLNGNNNVTSCWGLNKKGLCIIKKNKKDEWNQRLNSLANQISYWINPNNKIDKTVEIIQLYYDI